jgi:hypothetical protein
MNLDEHASNQPYPGVELHEVDADGVSGEPEVLLVRESGAPGGRRDAPDLVIVSGPLSSPRAQQGASRLARQQKNRQQALLVAVCDIADPGGAPPEAALRALYTDYDAVLTVAASQRRQLIVRLIRTLATLDESGQWLTCDWSDIRHMVQASATGLVRYGSGCRAGVGCAGAAAADAIEDIEGVDPGWRMARGVCVGIESSSTDLYGRAVKEVLAQVAAALNASATVTISARYNADLEPGAVEVNLFAFGERRPAQVVADDGGESETEAIDGGPDPLYRQARSLVLNHQRASISLIQRHLRIGYRQACELIDAMEGDVVSVKDDSGLRTVLHKSSLKVS